MDFDGGLLPIVVKRADSRYQRLMTATRDAAGAGYENVSMRELAEACHISLRTIYRRFCRSQDQLIAEAHPDGLDAFSDRRKQQRPTGESSTDRVIQMMRAFANALEADETLRAPCSSCTSTLDPIGATHERPRYDARST